MKKHISRKEKLEMLLNAIDLTALVIEVTLDNIVYKPKHYSKLREKINKELLILNTTVYI